MPTHASVIEVKNVQEVSHSICHHQVRPFGDLRHIHRPDTFHLFQFLMATTHRMSEQMGSQELRGKFEEVLSQPTKENAGALVGAVLEALELTASELATQLHVSPATVARWISKTSTPHSREIRTMQKFVKAKFAALDESGGIVFQDRTLGIWPFGEFFDRALSAKRVYVLKNQMGFHAGMSSNIKLSLKELLRHNRELQICYVYLKGSEAATTFKNFYKEIEDEFPSNVKSSELPNTARPMQMLGDVFASPFILEYVDDRIDVLIEVPVKVLATDDRNDLSGYTSVFIELPDAHKHQLWGEWKAELAREFTIVNIKIVSEFNESIDDVRSAAFAINGSSKDEFDPKSSFVVAECDEETVGSIRLTESSEASPLAQWAGDKCPLPTRQKGVVELTRGGVHPDKRGLQIYKWMMLLAMREAMKRKFSTVIAAIETEFPLQTFLFGLGFKPEGEVMTYDDLPRKGTQAQSLVCHLKESAGKWLTIERELRVKTPVKIVNP